MDKDEYRAARLALGLSQAQLAERLGIGWQTVLRREHGRARITHEAELAIRGVIKQAGSADSKAEVTPEMAEAGAAILIRWGLLDEPGSAAEIVFQEMTAAKNMKPKNS